MTSLKARIVQNYRLVWLVTYLDKNQSELQNWTDDLKKLIHVVDTFTDIDECVSFLREIRNEQVILIVPGCLGKHFVPTVHDFEQVYSVYIHCYKKSQHESWAKNWSKIVNIFTDFHSLINDLRSILKACDTNTVEINVLGPERSDPNTSNRLQAAFIYIKVLKEILMNISDEDDESNIIELTNYCRTLFAKNPTELKNVEQFAREYYEHTPIWWYTYECFLYPMLNRSLRLFEPDIIIKLGFFIRHLHHQLEQLHQEQCVSHKEPFVVYRGQGLSRTIFEKLWNGRGGYLNFSNFLSTSKEKHVSLSFAHSTTKSPELYGILFQMTIDPSISETPFALLNKHSFYKDAEQEVLFAMNTVFRIGDIKELDEKNRIWQVELSLTAANDPQLDLLTKEILSKTKGHTGWQRLALLFMESGHFDKSIDMYETLLQKSDKILFQSYFRHQIGCAKYYMGKYQESVESHLKALELRLQTSPRDELHVAASYNGLGAAYYSLSELTTAASYYEKALEIRENLLPPNDASLSVVYNNIAAIYCQTREYTKAIIYYEKSLKIDEINLSSNHPSLAVSYNNMGAFYNDIGDYPKALSYYQKAFEIRQRVLMPNHPDSIESCNSLASAYICMNEISKALEIEKMALSLLNESNQSNHPVIAVLNTNLGLIHERLGDYQESIRYHTIALAIRDELLSAGDPELAASHNSLAIVYSRAGQHEYALKHFQKALHIVQLSLADDHPTVVLYRQCFEIARSKASE